MEIGIMFIIAIGAIAYPIFHMVSKTKWFNRLIDDIMNNKI